MLLPEEWFCSPLLSSLVSWLRLEEAGGRDNFSLDQLPRWVHCMATKTLVPAQGRKGTQGMKQVVRRGKDENVSFADTTGINCLWNCGQSTSLVAKHRNGSRSPWRPSCWSRFFDYSNQMSLSCNSPAQNKDFFFFATSTCFQYCDRKRGVCWNRIVVVSKCNTGAAKSLNFRA